eukprot:COSAG02_NODE_61853_length_267_cov_0.922619_1_plen_21_part_01
MLERQRDGEEHREGQGQWQGQ